MQAFFEYSKEVREAQKNDQPLLALETTVITHGLPFPHNLAIALELEQIARAQQVIPATIALMNGKIKIGLSTAELEQLACDQQAVKASSHDLAFVLTHKLNAGTTVAATLACAHLAGIKLFATGGIGGVHRGDAMDISTDLTELRRTPLALICSGAKAILDIGKTLELLETLGIPVIGYRARTCPAFYTASSAYPLPMSIHEIEDLAKLLHTHWQLQRPEGMLITNPIPKMDEIPAAVIEPVITEALRKAAQKKITGKAITPFLLNAISQITAGKSLQANLSLLRSNVQLATELALAIKQLKKE